MLRSLDLHMLVVSLILNCEVLGSFLKIFKSRDYFKVEKILKGSLESRFNPITFTFSENSNYGRESLLEV